MNQEPDDAVRNHQPVYNSNFRRFNSTVLVLLPSNATNSSFTVIPAGPGSRRTN